MGLFIADKPHVAFTTFFWSFFLAWILAIIVDASAWWILFLGLSAVFFHKAFPHYDFGAANVGMRFIGGLTGQCENGACIQEFLFTIAMQFGGALLGGIVYNWWFDAAPIPVANLLNNDGANFVLFAFANFFQAYCLNRLTVSDTSLDTSMRLATAYTLSWVLCQGVYAGSIGGITIDFARLLAGKIVHGSMVSDEQFKKFWLLIAGPAAGWGVAFLYNWLENTLKAKEDGADKKEEEVIAAEPVVEA